MALWLEILVATDLGRLLNSTGYNCNRVFESEFRLFLRTEFFATYCYWWVNRCVVKLKKKKKKSQMKKERKNELVKWIKFLKYERFICHCLKCQSLFKFLLLHMFWQVYCFFFFCLFRTSLCFLSIAFLLWISGFDFLLLWFSFQSCFDQIEHAVHYKSSSKPIIDHMLYDLGMYYMLLHPSFFL